MTINISATMSAQLFKINISNSNIVECIETFNVTIISVTGCGVTIGSNNNSKVIIKDDLSKQIDYIAS